ncbi:MAG: glycosyltransferase, partial [Bryobacteraceae bacterium]
VDAGPFREQLRLKDSEITVVTVSRLDSFLKGESLFRTIATIGALGRELPLRFVLVGDGVERAKLKKQAADVNEQLGRTAVIMTGQLLDPRPAYAAADIVIGMGGSALRGMAFAKPVIVVGERGFSAPLTPETSALFLYQGMYGLGDRDAENCRLIAHIRDLSENRERLPPLGEYSREFVVRHFSLESVSAHLSDFCRRAASDKPRRFVAAADALRTVAVYLCERRFMTPSRSTMSVQV